MNIAEIVYKVKNQKLNDDDFTKAEKYINNCLDKLSNYHTFYFKDAFFDLFNAEVRMFNQTDLESDFNKFFQYHKIKYDIDRLKFFLLNLYGDILAAKDRV